MTQKLKAITADFLICFQTSPGIDANTIINGGDGKITGSKTTVKPQGKGYYGFKMAKGTTCEFELFDTKYTVSCPPKPDTDNVITNDFRFTNWGDLAKDKKTACIQRSLEVLGYYTGQVDDTRGEKTERAVLNIQADNKLRTDGVVGPKTLQKLKDVLNKNKSGKVPILRKNLMRSKIF